MLALGKEILKITLRGEDLLLYLVLYVLILVYSGANILRSYNHLLKEHSWDPSASLFLN